MTVIKNKKLSESSRRWLRRQLKDPYVRRAAREGYRSRAAYKLLELDEKYRFFKKGQVVVDLGAAPGSWSEVAHACVGPEGNIFAIDLLEMSPLEGIQMLQDDFLLDSALVWLEERIKEVGGVQVVLSDMSPATTGHRSTDHLRIMGLVEAAWDFAAAHLCPGGHFITKIFQGSDEAAFLQTLRTHFVQVRCIKPAASRKNSNEMYVIAMDYNSKQ